MIQQTSLMAYFEAKPKINRNQQIVFDALEEIYPATNKQIAKHLGWEINSVTPRILELRAKRKVVKAYQDLDGGRVANFWKPRVAEQEANDAD
jgi:DNA-binding MarR family transcriptional regulator